MRVKHKCAARALAEENPVGDYSQMHKHLRAWRLSKKPSLATVAERLGKSHSTVLRWETGIVRIAASDLERLASIYGAKVTQLAGPPEAADMIAVLDRTQSIVDRMDPETLEQWLAMGERLAR